jgi:N-ethylmaleimide reductase
MCGGYEGIAERYTGLAAELGYLGLAYLHLVDHSSMGAPRPEPTTVAAITKTFRDHGGAAVILSGAMTASGRRTTCRAGPPT